MTTDAEMDDLRRTVQPIIDVDELAACFDTAGVTQEMADACRQAQERAAMLVVAEARESALWELYRDFAAVLGPYYVEKLRQKRAVAEALVERLKGEQR